jgi:hypothetical protein
MRVKTAIYLFTDISYSTELRQNNDVKRYQQTTTILLACIHNRTYKARLLGVS